MAHSRPWEDRRTNKSPPVFYRTLSPSGLLPCFPSLQFTIKQSRAMGIADHILPMGDWFKVAPKQFATFGLTSNAVNHDFFVISLLRLLQLVSNCFQHRFKQLVIQRSHMVSGTQCPAWSDLMKKWRESRAAALKGQCPVEHGEEFPGVLRGHILGHR